MLAFLSLIITLLCFVQHGVSLRPSKAHKHRGLTNAQRFARGLPPAPPKRFFGSRSESARRSLVSAFPGMTVSGTIQFTAGGVTYYLGANGDVETVAGAAIPLQYVDPASSTTPVELQETSGPNEPLGIYFAFGAGSAITLSNGNYLTLLATTGQTSSGSAPMSEAINSGGAGWVETTIFMIDPTTGDITTTWINADTTTATDITLATDGGLLYMGTGTNYIENEGFAIVDSITFIQT